MSAGCDGCHHECRIVLRPFIVRFALIAAAILPLLGTQFQALRRLQALPGDNSDNLMYGPLELDQHFLRRRVTRQHFGNSLFSRIHDETKRSQESDSVLRTRKTRATEYGDSILRTWPVLNGSFTGPDEGSLGNFGSKRNFYYYYNDNSNPNTNGTILVPETPNSTAVSDLVYTSNNSGHIRHEYKIVGFTDFNFKDVALKWYQRLEELGYREHVIIAYDTETADYLQDLNDARHNEKKNANTCCHYRFETHILPPLPKRLMKMKRQRRLKKARQMIFAARWQYVLHQLQSGTSILLTDVDNLFHKHIHFAEHREFWTYDTIHAYEDKYPLSVYNQLGFTINGGMNWLQATPKAISFVEKLVEQCGTMCDDQVVLNELIANNETSGGLGIEWEATKNDGRDDDDDVHRPARFGRSRVTGHSLKIWDTDRVFRGRQVYKDYDNSTKTHAHVCPPPDINWVSMPIVDPNTFQKVKLTRDSASSFKLALYDIWNQRCRNG